jgi:hypothetical protein
VRLRGCGFICLLAVGAAAVAAFFVTLWTLACLLVAYRNRHKGDEVCLGSESISIADEWVSAMAIQWGQRRDDQRL